MRLEILLFAFLAGFAVLSVSDHAGAEAPESSELAAQRKEMKWRRRHIIVNNDGGDIFPAGADTPESFLAMRLKPMLDTQVDSVFYCTGATTMFTHRAKVGETYGKYITDKSEPIARRIRDNLKALAEVGTDPLELAVKFCHENDLEVFFTHRINDIHDSFLDWELSTWKREHPEYLMGTPEDGQKHPWEDPRDRWSALDFEIPEVRDYLLAIIDDVLTRYDVDGIEIDYWRNPMFFRPNLTFQPATPAQVEILTGFQRRVRQIAYAHGNRRGRPILVSTHVPISRQTCRHVGIDIERWLDEDLLDVLTTGVGCVPFTMPTRELVELGHAHGVPVYPSIAGSGRTEHQTMEHWRGAAANFWHAGADGVYLFNKVPGTPQDPHYTELRDPEKLARMDKRFVIDNQRIVAGGCVQAIVQSQILPIELDPSGEARQVILPVGDDVAGAAGEERLALSTLRVQFEGTAAGDAVQVRLNGNVIKPAGGNAESGWVTYAAEPSWYRHGDNVLAFRVSDLRKTRKPIVVRSVELRITHKQAKRISE